MKKKRSRRRPRDYQRPSADLKALSMPSTEGQSALEEGSQQVTWNRPIFFPCASLKARIACGVG